MAAVQMNGHPIRCVHSCEHDVLHVLSAARSHSQCNKKVLDNSPNRDFCQGRISISKHCYPRCHLEFTEMTPCTCGIPTYPRQLTYASRRTILCTFSTRAFPCALSGPFDELFHTRISAYRALCSGINAVISASTVYKYLIACIIAPYLRPVNCFSEYLIDRR